MAAEAEPPGNWSAARAAACRCRSAESESRSGSPGSGPRTTRITATSCASSRWSLRKFAQTCFSHRITLLKIPGCATGQKSSYRLTRAAQREVSKKRECLESPSAPLQAAELFHFGRTSTDILLGSLGLRGCSWDAGAWARCRTPAGCLRPSMKLCQKIRIGLATKTDE